MATRNDITGDAIQTRTITDTYRYNYDKIFGKKNKDLTDDTLTDEGNKKEDKQNDNV